MLLYLVSEALIIPSIFYFSGHSSSSLFVAQLSCNSKHLTVLTFQNTTFVCLYSNSILILFQFMYGFWSFICYCLPYKAFFTQLSIQSLPAIYNSLKTHFLFHTSVFIAARVESVMYLCAVFSHRQILSFSPLPPGGYSYLAGHAHEPESILWRYSTQNIEFVSQYLFFYTFLYLCIYHSNFFQALWRVLLGSAHIDPLGCSLMN